MGLSKSFRSLEGTCNVKADKTWNLLCISSEKELKSMMQRDCACKEKWKEWHQTLWKQKMDKPRGMWNEQIPPWREASLPHGISTKLWTQIQQQPKVTTKLKTMGLTGVLSERNWISGPFHSHSHIPLFPIHSSEIHQKTLLQKKQEKILRAKLLP